MGTRKYKNIFKISSVTDGQGPTLWPNLPTGAPRLRESTEQEEKEEEEDG
jgi:hypothetical protein